MVKFLFLNFNKFNFFLKLNYLLKIINNYPGNIRHLILNSPFHLLIVSLTKFPKVWSSSSFKCIKKNSPVFCCMTLYIEYANNMKKKKNYLFTPTVKNIFFNIPTGSFCIWHIPMSLIPNYTRSIFGFDIHIECNLCRSQNPLNFPPCCRR